MHCHEKEEYHLCIYIDKPGEGISINDCEKVNDAITDVLDKELVYCALKMKKCSWLTGNDYYSAVTEMLLTNLNEVSEQCERDKANGVVYHYPKGFNEDKKMEIENVEYKEMNEFSSSKDSLELLNILSLNYSREIKELDWKIILSIPSLTLVKDEVVKSFNETYHKDQIKSYKIKHQTD